MPKRVQQTPKSSNTSKLPRVSFEALRELIAYADCGSVSEAARALGENQPTVTRRLRHAFGRSKTPRGPVVQVDGQNRLLGLTAYGKQILPSVRDLVRQYERLADAIAGTDNVQQVVRLGVGAFGAEHYVPKCLAMLQPETKGWLIEVAVCRGRDRILRTVQGDLNLAVVTHTPEQIGAALAEAGFHREALFVERLATHRMCLALWEKPKLAKLLQSLPADRPVSVSHLAQFELVGLDEQSGIRRQLEQWADQAKRPLYFVPGTEAGGWNAAHQFVLQGLGAAILPASMFTGEIQKGLVVRRIVDELAVSDYLIRRDEDSTAACEAVRSMLRKLGRELTKKGGAHSLR